MQDKKELEAWENFVHALENKLPGFVKPWIMSLAPVLPLLEQSENEIYLIKSNQSFGIQVLQQKHLPVIEECLFEVTGFKRAVRFVLDETVKKAKQPKQTKELEANAFFLWAKFKIYI